MDYLRRALRKSYFSGGSTHTSDEIQGTLVRSSLGLLLSSSQGLWLSYVCHYLPEPYLDEFFHMPQAATYWEGNWTYWDDKITTPPGLYVYTWLSSHVLWFSQHPEFMTPRHLRWTASVLYYLLLAACVGWMRLSGKLTKNQRRYPVVLSLIWFPLLFFFSALYYTDVFSALTVMITYCCFEAGMKREPGWQKIAFQALHVLAGVVALTARQTNIFWVAVYMGGIQAVHTVKEKTRVHDPPVTDAYFEDVPIMVISLIHSALSDLLQLMLDLWPQLTLLASFAAFVVWNGGVVLGDKSNHVATIHLPQMLYIWPLLFFFSWPVVLPQLANPKLLFSRAPRPRLVATTLVLVATIVRSNTIVHEFILADNRHYTFYVFKILRHNPGLYYAAVPIYVICAWLTVQALGNRQSYSGGPGVKGSRDRRLSTSSGRGDAFPVEVDTNRISWLVVWFLSTTLSLVTAPLVEPRYFIVPWLLWRLHVPHPDDVLANVVHPSADEKKANGVNKQSQQAHVERVLTALGRRGLWIELVWYMVINFVTCYLFLFRTFEWLHEPGETQRFMW